MRNVVLVAHNVRSALNVGSMLRTAEGLGVEKVYLTGYTPYPQIKNDSRLPHVIRKQTQQIRKTALGAEDYIELHRMGDINDCLEQLKTGGYVLAALEQTSTAVNLDRFHVPQNTALVVGNEITGVEKDVLKKIPHHIKIPMSGRKESFNVAIAAAIALYHLTNIDKDNAKV